MKAHISILYFSTVVSTLEFKLRAYESVVLENTSSAGVIKVSLFIFIAAALRNFL